MNLRFISLTGADDKTNISELERFSEIYPPFECAILMFPERNGLARNPSEKWREKFYNSAVKNRSLHLCGTAINKLAHDDLMLKEEIENFQRVQINLKPQYASHSLIEHLIKIVAKHPQIEFITQYNDANREYFYHWDSIPNHSYLFDASLGKGLSPVGWQAPVRGKKCGYAGGLNPDNISHQLEKIKSAVGNEPIWIDMESGIRTDDQFDLLKSEKILKFLSA